MKSALTSGLLALLLAVSTAVSGAGEYLVFRMGTDEVKIFIEPCDTKAGVFEAMPEDMRKEYQRANVFFEGKNYEACWKPVAEGLVFLVDEEGDQGTIPQTQFKKPDVI